MGAAEEKAGGVSLQGISNAFLSSGK